jgi:molybdopterin molybdotransferase
VLPFEDALDQVLKAARRLPDEPVALDAALGRVLAEPLRAGSPLPRFDYSAMDGYAVRTQDLAGAGPWTLSVVGESRTGRPAPELAAGATCRIFTGAPIPAGADAVVMQENVERDGDAATFAASPPAGDHIRRAGEDLPVGAEALSAGTRLGPFQLGLVAALDVATVRVARRPRVVIVATGDELRPPGSADRPGSIPETNGLVVAALARSAGADVTVAARAADDEAATAALLRQALTAADVLVTIGGVSVGDHDVVRPALEAAGAELSFWKVAIRPGKPLVLGRAGDTAILGLPGNPASAQITFALFGLPLLRALQGDRQPGAAPREAVLTEPVKQRPGRRGFYRGVLEGDRVTPLTGQSSGATTSMAWANALIVVPETSSGASAGDRVAVLELGAL